MTVDQDQAFVDEQTMKINAWWESSPKQRMIKRPYTAETVAALRNSFDISYASSTQALKLFETLTKHRKEETCSMTFGAVDPVLVSQASKAGLDSIYVSGALCGLSLVDEPGMDHADYPWDTVPKAVSRVFKSQTWHDRRQRQFRLTHSMEERAKLPEYDYLIPIVADGDMGFGSITSTMKMAKMFVESGVAMIHIDDLAIGLKKFTIGQGRTLVPTSEYLKRLTAVRLQFDIMGAETMLLCRCDADHAEFITSVIDPRDHAYVQGTTNPVIEPLVAALNKASASGADLKQARVAWMEGAKLKTFDEAVEEVASREEYSAYLDMLKKTKFPSINLRREYAAKAVSTPVFFDWDIPRSADGQYFFRPTVQTIVERALSAAPLGEVTWARMDSPIWKDIVEFHESVSAVYPSRMYGFGYTGSYDYAKAGFTKAELAKLPQSLAALGICWQVQPIYALQGINLTTHEFAKSWVKDGIYGYVKNIQDPALKVKADGFENEWTGPFLADSFLTAVGSVDKLMPF